ncbi:MULTISPECIES: hypothetical protein [unclassified Psychrobacter]|uniref:hypothetical protein n=1 Tax=unclassified Psychrobacter TaxID=196806 RepID=UPI00402B7115
MADNWELIGKSSTSPKSNTNRAVVSTRVPKTENIIFIGSEMHYDLFWLKMMFVAASYPFVRSPKFRSCDKATIAYINKGYTRTEKLAIEGLKNEINANKVEFKAIDSKEGLMSILKNNRESFKLQDVAFFSHGLNGVITLNLDSSPTVNFTISDLASIPSNAFVSSGKFYSYACRTGLSDSILLRAKDSYDTLSEAKPEDSLAQKIANRFDIEVHAYYKRTSYANVIRNRSESESIVASLQEKREEEPQKSILNLSQTYQALKHDGLAETGILFLTGGRGEGTNGYALWRNAGGQALPTAAESPTGLPSNMEIFRKK